MKIRRLGGVLLAAAVAVGELYLGIAWCKLR